MFVWQKDTKRCVWVDARDMPSWVHNNETHRKHRDTIPSSGVKCFMLVHINWHATISMYYIDIWYVQI